ncbi:MAG: carboxypeptidase regulatory-like domain-containing protein [Candidatus Nealsonbacteria bacterium]|nr:carboxypeptidase regulatory-like domain-containing protein [Candidatus Nealsonbacteria bacterium]
MLRKFVLAAALLSVLAAAGPARSEAGARLDPGAMAAALDTAHPDEVAYITYTVALVDLHVLSGDLVDSSFQWARRKPARHNKFQYFKHAVINLASRAGVTMPQGTPDLTPTVQGRVVVRVVLIDVPVAGAVVRIQGTSLETTTNAKGQFAFENVPYGIHTVNASAVVILPKTGSTVVTLPNPTPPAVDPGFVTIRVN